jgi:hypothetical protein
MVTRRKKARQKRSKRTHHGKAPTILQGLPKGIKLIGAIPGMTKLSEVFQDFLEPYWKNEDELKKMLDVGLIAWNVACVSGQRRGELIESFLAAAPPPLREDLRFILADMIQRKVARFASDRRLILNYKLTTTPAGKRHLSVLYSPTSI